VPEKLDKIRGLHAEAKVWTTPMLMALVDGVRGGKWFSLIDKVCSPTTLGIAWESVRRNGGAAGVDKLSVERFKANAEGYLEELSLEELRKGLESRQYEPYPVRRKEIPKEKGKTRPLGIPTVKDRVVQKATLIVIEPIFENEFLDMSYGFRPGCGAQEALRKVDEQYVRKKSLLKLRERVRGLTKRSNGRSLKETIDKLNTVLRGWYNYFKRVEMICFKSIDGFIRRRLRAILWKRNKRKGFGKSYGIHVRWLNSFFKNEGYISLESRATGEPLNRLS
jgi:hypothetical protein